MTFKNLRTCHYVYFVTAGVLSFFTLMNYPGQGFIYIVYTILLNALFVLGFTRDRIFFDLFIGLFLWLGFWLKLSVRVAFFGAAFQEPVGLFNGTGVAYDHVLLATSCGVAALLCARMIRSKFLFTSLSSKKAMPHEATFRFYHRYRNMILMCFFAFFAAVGVTNLVLGVYQRGSVPRTLLPFGLGGLYSWLLLFGMTTISAVILDCEMRLRKNPVFVSVIGLLECFFSNISMLSRGMILNAGALLMGMHSTDRGRPAHMNRKSKVLIVVIFGLLFIVSVFVVNHVRRLVFPASQPVSVLSIAAQSSSWKPAVQVPFSTGMALPKAVADAITDVRVLVIDRWVGIEGVMAVSSYSGLGWDLWKRAWQEKYSHSGTSLFDELILEQEWKGIPMHSHHFINLPGALAFFYYPGSYPFLFACMVVLGLVGAGIEFFVYKFSGANIILCSLLAQVVAYRYTHFGYVPGRSYLLFGSLLLNVLMIYFLEKLLRKLTNTRQRDDKLPAVVGRGQ